MYRHNIFYRIRPISNYFSYRHTYNKLFQKRDQILNIFSPPSYILHGIDQTKKLEKSGCIYFENQSIDLELKNPRIIKKKNSIGEN